MSRTLAPAPTDRSMWRRLLALAHPDGHGAHDWFVWASAFREHVAGDYVEPAKPADYHRPRRTTIADSLRVDFTDAYVKAANFDELTRRALDLAAELPEPYSGVLWALVGCYRAGDHAGPLYRSQWTGATYKSLAAIGHRAGMTGAERIRWYRICESIPLSQRHAGHILSKLQRAAA